MATVGVVSFPHMTSSSVAEGPGVLESLLLDLLSGSLSQLSGDGHVTSDDDHVTSTDSHVTYACDLVRAVMTSGAAQLREAVILSLPLLLRTVTGFWGTALPPVPREKLVAIMCSLFDHFNAYVLAIALQIVRIETLIVHAVHPTGVPH